MISLTNNEVRKFKMKPAFKYLPKITAGMVAAVLACGASIPAYANTLPASNSTDIYVSQGIDTETAALLDKMAAEFEREYNYNPAAFDATIAKLGSSLSAQPTLDQFSPKSAVIAPYASWDSYARCVGEGIAAAFAIDVLKQAINKPVIDALKSRQWRVASSIIHTNLSRILGSKGASFVIKKIASKALPGGLPGQLIWIAAKCGVKEFI